MARSIIDAHQQTFLAFYNKNEINKFDDKLNAMGRDESELQRLLSIVSRNKVNLMIVLFICVFILKSKADLYIELADKLTSCVQQIIDFSKMVPGFMQLLQDDQIALLKSGSYGIMLLYATQYYVQENNCFLYNQKLVNLDLFLTKLTAGMSSSQSSLMLDDEEIKFVKDNMDFIRQLKQFNLSDSELAILSAIILFNPNNNDLLDQKFVYHQHQKFVEILRMDMENNRNQSSSSSSSLVKQQMLQQLLNLVSVNLKRLSFCHFDIIKSFKMKYPNVEFPPLHRELFNVDYIIYYDQQIKHDVGHVFQCQNSVNGGVVVGGGSGNVTGAGSQITDNQAFKKSSMYDSKMIKCEGSDCISPSSCSSASSSSSSSSLSNITPNSASLNGDVVISYYDKSAGLLHDPHKVIDQKNLINITSSSFTASSLNQTKPDSMIEVYHDKLDDYSKTMKRECSDGNDTTISNNIDSFSSSYVSLMKPDQFFSSSQSLLPIRIE